MKNLQVLWTITLAVMLFSSCQVIQCGADKKSFLAKYENFIDKVDRFDWDITDHQWDSYDKQFKQYIEECYDYFEADLTNKEKRYFWMQTLNYYAIRYGEGMINQLSRKDAISDNVRENIEEVLEGTGRDLEDFVNKNMTEIEELVKDIGKDVEDWASKLKEILQE